MKITKESQLRHGLRVKGKIEGVECRGKIAVGDGDAYYFCQNKKNGINADDKLGYDYSWKFTWKNGEPTQGVTDLETTDDIRPAVVGDILVNKYEDKRKVLGVCGEIVFISEPNKLNVADSTVYTFDEIADLGWKIKDDPSEGIKEYSMDEVAKALGEKVENIRIKKED